MNKREVGSNYEELAVDYLKSIGYRILCRNYRCKLGEIDIIAMEGDTLCFIEVKYRSSLKMGSPLEAVTKTKQNTIRKVAKWYLMEYHYIDIPIRFDVVGILKDEITLIQAAF